MTENPNTCTDELTLSTHKLAQLRTLIDDLDDEGALSYASTLLVRSGQDGISRLSYAEMEPMLGSRIAGRSEHTLTVRGVLVERERGKPRIRVGGEERLVEERQYEHARSQAIRRAIAVLDKKELILLGERELDPLRRRNASTGWVWERPREIALIVDESDEPWRWQGAPAWLLRVLLDSTMRPITRKVALRLCCDLDATGTVVVNEVGSTALSRQEMQERWGVHRDVIIRGGETQRKTPTCLDELSARGLIAVVKLKPPEDGRRQAMRWTITAVAAEAHADKAEGAILGVATVPERLEAVVPNDDTECEMIEHAYSDARADNGAADTDGRPSTAQPVERDEDQPFSGGGDATAEEVELYRRLTRGEVVELPSLLVPHPEDMPFEEYGRLRDRLAEADLTPETASTDGQRVSVEGAISEADGEQVETEPEPVEETTVVVALVMPEPAAYTIRVGVPYDSTLAMILAGEVGRGCCEGDTPVAVGWTDGSRPLGHAVSVVDTRANGGRRPAIETAVHSTLRSWHALPAEEAA